MSEPQSASPGSDPEAISATEQIETLLRDRSLDGVVRYLQHRFPDAPETALEDAVLTVIDRIVRRRHGPKDDIFSYLTRAATNAYVTMITRSQNSVPLAEEHDHGGRPDEVEFEAEQRNAGHAARVALDYLRALIRRWDNERMALVVELHLRAAVDDEPLSAAEAADHAGSALDEEMNESTARLLKHRGLARLRRQLDHNRHLDPRHDEKEHA